MNNPFSLERKTILITGASSGIGRATAIECANQGAQCCILLGRNLTALEETASKLHPKCNYIITTSDLSQFSNFNDFVPELPDLDGVVLNAGINNQKLLQFTTEKDLQRIFDLNCFSPILLLKHLIKKKKIQNNASIVFTSSISGYSNFSIGNGPYGASKSAMISIMKYFALELAPKGIRCNAILPGRVETPLIHRNISDEDSLKNDKIKYPLKRYGKPEEIAYAIIYLLSKASSWVTGSSIVIDGGRSLI